MSSKNILKLIKDKQIEFVDLRFTDPRGKLQHLTMDSTIVDEDMQLTDCNSHEGSITTTINNPINQVFYFLQRYDTLFNLWPTITTSPGTLDSIYTMSFTDCGAYRVVVYDGLLSLSDTTNTYLIACDTMSGITSVPGQTNIQCFGDSTGELRYEVIGGTPFIDS